MKKILVSQCLYGEKVVRYDGREKICEHPIFLKWKEEGRLVPVCPEVEGGLSVPRLPSERLLNENSSIIKVCEAGAEAPRGIVVNTAGEDVSDAYRRGSYAALDKARFAEAAFCILKERSPACGVHEIYDGTFTGKTRPGMGVAAEMFRMAEIRVFSEDEIEEAAEYLATIEKK